MLISNPYFFTFSFLIVTGCFFSLPFFSYLDDKEQVQNRCVSMDSLRYFLASFVFFAHSLMIYTVITENSITGRASNYKLEYLAFIGVSLFFMITGFLFWEKIRKPVEINWINLYKGRFFRIVPLIFFQSTCSIILILLITYFLNDSGSINFKGIGHWYDFINNSRPDINGFSNSWVLTAGVYWTLVYEWGFYFSLPLLFLFRKRSFEFVASLCFLIIYASSYFKLDIKFEFLILFILGMLCVEVVDKIQLKKRILDIILLISIIVLIKFRPTAYDVSSYINLLLFLILFCIVKGADLFGFLKLKGFIRLGNASYSIYIMHSIILFCSFKIINYFYTLNNISSYILYIPYFIILIVSSLTYRYIEIPFNKLGRKIKI